MKTTYKSFLAAVMLFLSATAVLAQQQKSGLVCDERNNPIAGVVVSVKGANTSVVTDAEGTFPLTFENGDVLTFKHIGYLYKEERYSSYKTKTYTVHLTERFKDEEKPLVLFDGSTRSVDANLGSVSTVYGKDMEKYLSTDILTSLQGRMAGFNISQYRGSDLPRTSVNTSSDLIGFRPASYGQTPFGDNTRFSLSARGMSPVVIVDGVERELLSLDPEAIESVTLQRDALSSMFLGMKSSRGALIVTTKNPISGKMHFNFTGKWGIHSSVNEPKPVSAAQYAYLLNEALQNDGRAPIYNAADRDAYANQNDPFIHPDVNWYDELMNNHALSQSYNLNVSGGGRVAQFFVSLGYTNEEGLFKTNDENGYNTNLDLNRYMISSKVNINITDDFTATMTAIGRVIEGNQPGGSGSGYSDLLLNMWRTPNNAYPVKNPDGTWGGTMAHTNNLAAQGFESGYINDNTRDVLATLKLKYDFNKLVTGLSAKFAGSVAQQTRTAIIRTKQNPVYNFSIVDGKPTYLLYGNSVTQSNSFRAVSTYQNLYGQLSVDYERQFGKHHLKASVMGDTRHEVVQYDLPMIPSNIMETVQYDYAGRYFLQAATTQSYFNRYAPDNRWGQFFAFGAGWDISREQFMQQATWLDKLKLRATYGHTGNGIDNSGYYQYRQRFSQNATAAYPQGSSQSTNGGIFTTETMPIANQYITYEKAHKLNIGLDFALLNRRLSGTIEYYNDKYLDLLQTRGKSIELMGATYPTENIGRSRRQGFDVSLTWQDHVGPLNYYVSGSWSLEKTKLLFMDEQEQPYNYLRQTGRPVGVIYGLQAIGFLSAEDIANGYPVMEGTEVQPGDVKYADLNSDGIIDEYDRCVIGGDKPLHYFGLDMGLEFHGFEFSMMWQGVYNRDLYVNDRTLVEGFQSIGNSYGQAYQNIIGRWTPETASTATYPRLSVGGNTYNYGGYYNSSLWMHSGNFIRLKNISLAYNLPETICRNYLSGLRAKVFVNAQNLVTFSACDLVDPEVSFTSSPLQRCFFTGISLNF
ncbi:SusC/RagA family TonB-linked outer membrane protein [Prevotella sp. E9-3]|uniref:SusC/RagA family TonB-linked outer membrane protein n=1 Tax=Prevotella sp. E9-3 TaxID=2913621 RepID=UPI001EDA42C0|nr:SusC/RagA family TonB-linked outer membrane protein [Prevotella sp. E9-3]UKK49043.1 SusC/RagA family TonB-linked outer membrane protein [Prevotella sp. E9-3]